MLECTLLYMGLWTGTSTYLDFSLLLSFSFSFWMVSNILETENETHFISDFLRLKWPSDPILVNEMWEKIQTRIAAPICICSRWSTSPTDSGPNYIHIIWPTQIGGEYIFWNENQGTSLEKVSEKATYKAHYNREARIGYVTSKFIFFKISLFGSRLSYGGWRSFLFRLPKPLCRNFQSL